MIRKLTKCRLRINFVILNGLKISDDVLILSLQYQAEDVSSLQHFFERKTSNQ
jgi:hypothetical protein